MCQDFPAAKKLWISAILKLTYWNIAEKIT